jgi:hypothetical protein
MSRFLLGLLLSILVSACSSVQANPLDSSADSQDDELDIITLLPKDAIRSIDNPEFYEVSEADREYADEELVLGVIIDGDARAYSTGLLSGHEIVNDVVGGRPIAVTW